MRPLPTLYLAGPMTGRARWNFDAFLSVGARLETAGYRLVNPAEIELRNGFDPDAPVGEFSAEDYRAALRRDVAAIFAVDGVAVLPGWESSKGARAEVALATALGLPVQRFTAWLSQARQTEEGSAP